MTLPKTKSLDDHGLAHFIMPLVVVLLVGVVGTYMLVASHANPVKPKQLRIVSAKIIGAPMAVDGEQNTVGIVSEQSSPSILLVCSKSPVVFTYVVKTNIPVNKVMVSRTVNEGGGEKPMRPDPSGDKTSWHLTVGRTVCADKKGKGSITINAAGTEPFVPAKYRNSQLPIVRTMVRAYPTDEQCGHSSGAACFPTGTVTKKLAPKSVKIELPKQKTAPTPAPSGPAEFEVVG